ncbi:MAG: crossover junction endodeoxyribonuclease RuvC [Deltaproteobacteria bacterium]|nr:MAG: crossover junction endodeoxyribonuclease RuvC [Deltaproteobacteria bacterium]RLB02800.1 MAG: crossover junction endodeoxyribonuclease RuvC [Deltaproteobacteria bacterium]
MRVLGIDPGSFSTGYGIIGAQEGLPIYLGDGVISLKGDLLQRLKGLYEGIKGLITQYQPEAIALESPFVAKNIKSALRLGQIQGVISLAAADSLLPLYEYSPMEVKIALTGYGRATKEQVREMVKRLLGLEEDPSLDASDALAVAICHLHRAWES